MPSPSQPGRWLCRDAPPRCSWVERPRPSPPARLHCSMAANVKYIWPIQQPITDFGAQRQRLKDVRRRLGWRLTGCDLIECYEE